MNERQPLLKVRHLKKHFDLEKRWFRPARTLKAVDGVNFDVFPGETLSIVGESGCGKSTTAKLVIRLLHPTSGTIELSGRDLAKMNQRELRLARKDIQMVFQDPYASLNPRWTVERILREPMNAFQRYAPAERRERVLHLLQQVGLNPSHAAKYPHEFSGGQRQRIGIARALVLNPKLVIADEPVSALDISIQAQVINLMQDLQEQLGLTYLFISHDLSVVEHISTRVIVMYLGKIVEFAPVEDLFQRPLHPYTQALLAAAPSLEGKQRMPMVLSGDVPNPVNPPSGCPFHTRCPVAMPRCKEAVPELKTLQPGHQVACLQFE
ncbi:dipeptide ABC transporter ATP-binding protein [Alicyclobacillus cycloheptanicus]|nr:dipeptide ABC transporter ATP-binding protein [Alicyclobacillus cycloheptanicus]